MKPTIAIILTSIERDKALFQALKSIMDNAQGNWMIIIGYQSETKTVEFSNPQVYMYQLPYNCGISFARNDMISKAHALGCEYVLLSADSILFNESMKDINNLLPCFKNYDLIGLNLLNRIQWEANLKLIPNESFELDFIEKNVKDDVWCIGDKIFNVWPCDIVRNFWLAKIETLLQVPYDDELIMCEHEDWFYRFKQARMKVGCTNLVSGIYNKLANTPEYDKIRANNFRIGKQRLIDKYSLKNWVVYKNLERTKE